MRKIIFLIFLLFFTFKNEAQELPTITDYQPEVVEVVDETTGFIHPGVGLTKDILENARAQIIAENEPWFSYYHDLASSGYSARDVFSSNDTNNDGLPDTNAFNSQGVNSRFIQDGLKVYSQALLYYITGDEVYRSNALKILRIWEQMVPSLYVYFTDACIHTGIPMNRMMTGAEIIRYSSSPTAELEWTEKDTMNLTNNLINPVIETFQHTKDEFMNQHLYPLMGAMAGYIFTNNLDRYKEAVEWMTVNSTANNQGFNGSVKRLFRLVDTNAITGEPVNPVVQHVEMGRDQAHGGGDLTNAAIIARMFYAQNTLVDPVDGTFSTDSDAIGIYEFFDDRIFTAANYFWQYMLGYETNWVPTPFSIFPDGSVRGIYSRISDLYRGRYETANFWDLYYYYTYTKGENLAEKAPYFYEAFTKRIPSEHYYQGSFKRNWENVDGGGDFWLYIPAEAAGTEFLPKPQVTDIVEVEERYTAFDDFSETVVDGDDSYIRMRATESGSKVALLNLSYANRVNDLIIGMKVRTNGNVILTMSKERYSAPFQPYQELAIPDTHGEWIYVTYNMGISHVNYAQMDTIYSIVYLTVTGEGAIVDIDHLNVGAGGTLTPPQYTQTGNQNIFAYIGAPIQLDFSATDVDVTDTVSYEISYLPNGAVIYAYSGEFKWQPAEVGEYSFIVSAKDDETWTTRLIKIFVGATRMDAVNAAITEYDEDEDYVESSLESFQAKYNETMSSLDIANDGEFIALLMQLRSATEALQLLSPRLEDGSLNFTEIVTSTFVDQISMLVDNNNNTYPVYTLAPYPNLYHIMDFGPNYNVTATAFGLQGRMNFDDRMAGMTVFASNDGYTWTRITSGETPYTSEIAQLQVDEEFLGEQFRYLKFEMINPQPDALRGQVQNILELGELRIYGDRIRTNNKIISFSVQSDATDGCNVVLTGNEVTVNFTAEEVINNVSVLLQGVDVPVISGDGLNWTGSAVLADRTDTGYIRVNIVYQTLTGQMETFNERSELFLMEGSDIIESILDLADLIDPSTSYGRPSEEVTIQQTGYLFDHNPATNSDFRLRGNGAGGYIIFDFRFNCGVSLTSVDILARQDQYFSRINGAVIQGANELPADNGGWTTLTGRALSTKEWQSLDIEDSTIYRYIRIYNSNAWYGNMAEVRLHGVYYGPVDLVESISITSPHADPTGLVTFGDTVVLTIQTTEQCYDMDVDIQGETALVVTTDNLTWWASITLPEGVQTGNVNFSVNYFSMAGRPGLTESLTTDNTKLFLIKTTDLITDMLLSANYSDPSTSYGRPNEEVTRQQVGYLFDSNPNTVSDFRNGNNGTGGYIIFDLGVGNEVWLTGAEVLARQGTLFTRINGMIIQGSNDNINWIQISSSAISTAEWQSLQVSVIEKYRYIRIYNSRSWYGNMAELRLHAEKAPVLETIGDKLVNEGQLLEFTISATDPNNDALTYSTSNLPIGASFNPVTQTFSWTPDFTQAGTYTNIRFEVNDGSLTDSEEITITVVNVNRAPELSAISDKIILEGEPLKFIVSAIDPDNDNLTFSASNLPIGASFDPATQTFSWTPDFNQAGTYANIMFEVTDGALTDSEDITITVNKNIIIHLKIIPKVIITSIGGFNWVFGIMDVNNSDVDENYKMRLKIDSGEILSKFQVIHKDKKNNSIIISYFKKNELLDIITFQEKIEIRKSNRNIKEFNVEIYGVCKLKSGEYFQASDTIKIIGMR